MSTTMFKPTLPAKLLDQHRYDRVEFDDWWQFLAENFDREMLEKYGIELETDYDKSQYSRTQVSSYSPKIEWEMHCQGAGARFEGRVADWPKFLKAHGYDLAKFPMLLRLAEIDSDRVNFCSTFSNSRSSHEHATTIEFAYDYGSILDFTGLVDAPTDELTEHLTDIFNQQIDVEVADAQQNFAEDFRTHMREFYRRLDAAYDDETSDETVEADLRDRYTDDELVELIDEALDATWEAAA